MLGGRQEFSNHLTIPDRTLHKDDTSSKEGAYVSSSFTIQNLSGLDDDEKLFVKNAKRKDIRQTSDQQRLETYRRLMDKHPEFESILTKISQSEAELSTCEKEISVLNNEINQESDSETRARLLTRRRAVEEAYLRISDMTSKLQAALKKLTSAYAELDAYKLLDAGKLTREGDNDFSRFIKEVLSQEAIIIQRIAFGLALRDTHHYGPDNFPSDKFLYELTKKYDLAANEIEPPTINRNQIKMTAEQYKRAAELYEELLKNMRAAFEKNYDPEKLNSESEEEKRLLTPRYQILLGIKDPSEPYQIPQQI
jgi:hypothetical protein